MSQFDRDRFENNLLTYLPYELTQRSRFYILKQVDSTNDYLKRQAENLAGDYALCIADHQTEGRGRQGKIWQSPKACNLYLSLAYPYDDQLPTRPIFSLIASLAVAQALTWILEPFKIGVKWPNDLVYHDQKLAGVLIEFQRTEQSHNWLIIGVGINVNLESQEDFLNRPWTSLTKLTGNNYDRAWVASIVVKALINKLNQVVELGPDPLLKEWAEYDALRHRHLQINYNDHNYQGEGMGIDRLGRLLLWTPEHKMLAFDAGEITYI